MRVLIADDDPISCNLLQRKLIKWGYEVVICSDGASALEVMEGEDAPQLAIIDWMMPRLDGLAVCRLIREKNRDPYTYVLILTARTNREDVIQGLDAGADDYICKPFDSNELKVRLRVGRRILDLQNGLLRSQDELRIQATYDSLTGVWNRGAVLDILGKELQRAEREEKSLGLLMADLDHFKLINDYHGHLAGDAVLREVCRRMHKVVRPYDSIGRYGGEEFLIVLPGSDAVNAQKIAERIREHIRSHPVYTSEGTVGVTLSLGVALSGGSHRIDADTLIRASDTALYSSKRRGKDCVTLASSADMYRVATEYPRPQLIRFRLTDEVVAWQESCATSG